MPPRESPDIDRWKREEGRRERGWPGPPEYERGWPGPPEDGENDTDETDAPA